MAYRLHPKPVVVIFGLAVFLLVFTVSLRLQPKLRPFHHPPLHDHDWFQLVSKDLNGGKVKIGLVNVDDEYVSGLDADVVSVQYERVSAALTWKDFFPEWIDEEEERATPSCPEMPMPEMEEYGGLDVVVVGVACGNWTEEEGVRDVGRLQANLVAANLAVSGGAGLVVFVGRCGPMWEIFRCDDMVKKGEGYWVYRPEMRRLRQKTLMPLGTCQLPPGIAKTTESNRWKHFISESNNFHKKEAYVTMLHSSETYVCGAIALAQSIKLTNSTKDLLLLADDHVTPNSRQALSAAGWTVLPFHRIRSPHAAKGAYNEWNYSKLRIWQLTSYDTIMFIDSDLLVLSNIDHFFQYPQLSAAANSKMIFNSGLMVVEPSRCTFDMLINKTRSLPSYNGGDQGFLNEVFTWWHRFPARLNYLKMFKGTRNVKHEVVGRGVYALHFLGVKPWLCYRDYDCNWDVEYMQVFASDSAHRRWYEMYDALPEKLRPYCGLTAHADWRIRKWRGIAKKANLSDGHWRIKVRDERALPLKKQLDFS